MRNLALFFKLFLFLWLIFPLYGTVTKNGNKSFLWEIERGNQHIYLLGSIHVATQDFFPLKKAIEAAYADAQTIIVEVDLNKAAGEMAGLLRHYAFLSPGQSVTDLISRESRTLLENYFKQRHLDGKRLEKMKPWYIAVLIANSSFERIGAKSYLGIDRYFTSQAYRDAKKVVELEGAAMQLAMLDALPLAEQELLLRSSILEDTDMETSFKKMALLWKQGDIEGMDAFMKTELSEYPELHQFNQKLITERNKSLTKKIIALAKKGENLLVIVGAAHFTGETGIIKLLEKEGYTPVQR